MTEWLATGLLCLLFLNGLMYFQQPRMLFLPSRALDATPADWDLAYEDVRLTADDGTALHGWFIPHPGARRVLLFLHGNAGNISHRGDSVKIFHDLGMAVFIFDYRGYGQSDGAPSEDGLYLDAEAAWRYLTEVRGVDPQDIVVFGRSLGGAVAAQLASRVDAGGVILESSFSSARDAARAIFPLLSRLVVLRYRFDAARALAQTSSPVMVLHSRDDEIMPLALGHRLYEAAPQPKRFVTLRGDHNGGFLASRPAYDQSLAAFLAGLR